MRACADHARTRSACYARAANGHATAAPPSRSMQRARWRRQARGERQRDRRRTPGRPRHAPVRAGFDSPIAIATLDLSSQRSDGPPPPRGAGAARCAALGRLPRLPARSKETEPRAVGVVDGHTPTCPLRPLGRLAQEQEPGVRGGEARGGRVLGAARNPMIRCHPWAARSTGSCPPA
jgi:hypothetical protein